MNKDVDERIVPNGQYRDALNVQVVTTDSDSSGVGDAGTLQNLKGNTLVATGSATTGYDGKTSKIIGSIADEAEDASYYFIAAPVPLDGLENIGSSTITSSVSWIDSIIRLENNGTVTPIIVDKFAVTETKADVFTLSSGDIVNSSTYLLNAAAQSTPGDGYEQIVVTDGTKYRVGMRLYATTATQNLLSEGNNTFVEITKISNNTLTLSSKQTADLNTAVAFKFIYPERVLEFDYYKSLEFGGDNILSSINILNDLLMWTDGKHEPKKINIKRCISGTTSLTSHTKLHVKHPLTSQLVSVSTLEDLDNISLSDDIKKENITVIKTAPTTAPTIVMKDTDRDSVSSFPLTNYFFVIDFDGNGVLDEPPIEGDERMIEFQSGIDFRIDDIYTFEAANAVEPITLRGKVIAIDENNINIITIKLLLVDKDLTTTNNPGSWNVSLEKRKPLFETKFGRFGYRYKYEDNECSTFSPWSELAFLPGDFAYTSKKGFNEGMANGVRQLIVRDFIPNNHIRPNDVKTIEILWKTSDNSNIYIVKSITREVDTEWRNFVDGNESNTGEITITSETIYKVVEANQLLRSWDNVPRYAVAQEVTGNRLVYGNYKQGYDVNSTIGLKQTVVSELVPFPNPKKSVKSLRNYQFGVVIGDRYGRETPVIANGYKADDGTNLSGDVSVSKTLSSFSNKFKIEQSWNGSDPSQMQWMDYIKYYVKETSNEYYNLILDRWYNSEDENVWLSFVSSDRNKINEDTYLILKNEHGSQTAVEEKARYKVLAIDNNAPDHIKTDNRDFDRIEIDKPNAYGNSWTAGGGNITDGLPASSDGSGLVGNKTIRTANSFNVKGQDFKGIPKARIVAEYTTNAGVKKEAFTPFKTVARFIVSNDEEDPEDNGIVLREAFTSSQLNLYQKIIVQLDDVSELPVGSVDTDDDFRYFIELRDAVVENKPQFDGKFFVKVAKDDVLEEKVLGQQAGNYEVLSTYEIGYIANQQENPAQTSDYASTQPFEDFAWPSNTQLGFSNSTIAGTTNDLPNFGPGDSNTTDTFWVAWYNNGDRTADIFIDEAPAFSGFNLQTADGVDALPAFNSGTSEINTVDGITNWQPQGLSNGTFEETVWGSDDNMGQLTFSMIGGTNNPMWVGTNSYFKAKMQTPGTLFRFRDDPNQTIYQIFHSHQDVTGSSQGIPAGPITINSKNFDNDGSSIYVDRTSIIVRFHRVNSSGANTGGGLDASVWDPRAEVQHNGLGSMTVEIVQRVSSQDITDDTIATNAACFETEPKEDVGLDIYYEASSAVPIRLSQRTIKDFAVPNDDREKASLFKIDTRTLSSNTIQPVTISGNPFVYQTHGGKYVQIRRDINGTATNLKTIITNNISDGVCAAIDDIVSFEDRTGLVKRSKIKDHVKINNSTVIVPSDRATFSNATVGEVNNQANQFFYVAVSGITSDINGNSVIGAEVTGSGIEKGTFVESLSDISFGAATVVISKKPSSFGTYDVTLTIVTGTFELDTEVWKYPVDIGWHNCYSFGNGVESDRIRDDFNTPTIDNGIKVSSTFLEYGEEQKESSMIFSGLYNSTSGVNDLNQFNMAEKITKDLNTTYGSIQRMKTRDNDVVVFTEDKVLKVLANKDAIFNADGQAQLTATDRVLGQTIPFAGDYGISKNPESLAVDNYRMYFTDMQRGAVLRLSGNGVTPISEVGMKAYFRENLKSCDNLIGSFDGINDEYNLTLKRSSAYSAADTTISFNEKSKGWVSFKSFVTISGLTVSDKYYTVSGNKVYEHYSDTALRNNFYDVQYDSMIEVIFNEAAGSVKSFKTINYEGSQSKINQFTTETVTDAAGNSIVANDGEYYNLTSKNGWYVETFATDLQEGSVPEFIEKEGKWFNNIKGKATTLSNLDTSEISVQGIGFPTSTPAYTDGEENQITITINAV